MKHHSFEDPRKSLREIIENEEIMRRIHNKEEEFLSLKSSSRDRKFSELIFCTLTANTSAEMGLRCQNYLEGLQDYSFDSIKFKLIECKYRFKNTRARFIEYNYRKVHILEDIIQDDRRRELLVENYMGIGMKEASHFLRNIGYFQYSILDKHIQRFLESYYSREIRIRNRKDYESVELLFMRLSEEYGMEPGIMDLVVWYMMTGKIIK